MRNSDQLLSHILSLSRQAPDPIPTDLPFGLETAVVAHWRSASQARRKAGTLAIMRWAAAGACAIAITAAVVERDQIILNDREMETRVADSAVAAALGND
jgi:hypothetical protein